MIYEREELLLLLLQLLLDDVLNVYLQPDEPRGKVDIRDGRAIFQLWFFVLHLLQSLSDLV